MIKPNTWIKKINNTTDPQALLAEVALYINDPSEKTKILINRCKFIAGNRMPKFKVGDLVRPINGTSKWIIEQVEANYPNPGTHRYYGNFAPNEKFNFPWGLYEDQLTLWEE